MTRDYNKQRDNVRPFSRNQSPNRTDAERSPRQDRPRLNRETVDRAWEAGAPSKHADYRTRSSSQPPRNRWNNNQPSERPQYGRGPSGNRPNGERSFERTPNGNAGPRSRSYDPNRRNFDDRRGYPEGPNRNGARQGFRDNSRPYEQGSQSRDNDQDRGYQRSGPRRFDQQPRDFNPNNRSPRNAGPGNFKRDNRPPRNSDGPSRPPYRAQRPDAQNPRWQSRPQAQRGNSFQDQEQFNEREPENEQFEGDYERFDGPREQKRPKTPPYQRAIVSERTRPEAEKRHVTRLADGRVLKGPRPAQRKNAQFWTDVADETGNLIDQVQSDSPPAGKQADQRSEEALQEAPAPGKGTPKAQRKPRARASSGVKRERKSGAKKDGARPSSTAPKPSQRGFKWPTP